MRNNQPEGATHISDLGIYYKLQDKFWYVYHDNGWYAVSGKPLYNLKEL